MRTRLKKLPRRQALARGTALALAMTGLSARADEVFPSRRVEIIVPFPAGGTADFLARVIGEKLAAAWGQPVIISNRAGATGAIGAESAAQAAPDGHTLLLTSYANRKVLFAREAPVADPARDLVPVALLAKPPLVLVAHPSLPAQNLRELIALAKRTGGLNYASIGPGTPSHLAMEMLKHAAGIALNHVPYRGSGPALTDLVAGHVPLMFDSVVSASGHVRTGRLRALAVSTAVRLPLLPDVPTVVESGVPDFDVSTWAALYVPPRTSADRIARVHEAVGRVLRQPEVIEKFLTQGAVVAPPMEPTQVADFVRADVAAWRKLIAETRIQAE